MGGRFRSPVWTGLKELGIFMSYLLYLPTEVAEGLNENYEYCENCNNYANYEKSSFS